MTLRLSLEILTEVMKELYGELELLYLDLESGYIGNGYTHTIMKLTLNVSGIHMLNYVCCALIF